MFARHLTAGLLAVGALAVGHASAADKLRVRLIDVEGGAATLFVAPGGESLLVDTGWAEGGVPGPSSADRIVEAARSMGLSRIDYLVISHYHGDHVGGAPELLSKFPVGAVVDHGPNREEAPQGQPASPRQPEQMYAAYLAAAEGRPRIVAKPGDSLQLGDVRFDFVVGDRAIGGRPNPPATPGCAETPSKSQIGGEENPRSLGFVASYGEARILNLSDLTWDMELALVCPENRLGRIDLLIVSHHGSDLSNPSPLFAATRPRVALMGNGARKGGDEGVLRRLAAAASAPAVWQSHYSVRAPDANTAETRIANLDGGPDAHHPLTAEVSADGVIVVINSRNQARETYRP